MEAEKELFLVAENVGTLVTDFEAALPTAMLVRVTEICDRVQKSWSGSNLGYHAQVYFEGLRPAPPGANFSPEWGLPDGYSIANETDRRYGEFDPDEVKKYILDEAGNPDLARARQGFRKLATDLPVLQRDVISILSSLRVDDFLKELMVEIRKVSVVSIAAARNALLPRGQVMTRDTLALTQGTRLAPHQEIWGEMLAFSSAFASAKELMTLTRQAASHLRRRADRPASMDSQSRAIFVGHGRSLMWRELKDFLQDTLGLQVEEFGRVPTAGISTTARLYEMLDNCGFAFLVMTGEDETADGQRNARMNVVHEVGLFQGRLGASKAIVMLEDGCSEFSNIQGLGQLRFPTGRISAVFEDVRQVLRREGLIGG